MENLVRNCYIEPKKIAEEKSETEEVIELDFEYFPKADITEDEF